ncbi:MAG: MBL fold metallo-hydrolase [Ruthenibacterium lactatiformans]
MPHLPEEAAGAATKVHFIDVGQGDAVLLEQNGAFALIDAGEREAADGLVAYLQAAGVAKLDLLVMTHPHADHIGGMQAVLDAFLWTGRCCRILQKRRCPLHPPS